jgi:hypothetical protein
MIFSRKIKVINNISDDMIIDNLFCTSSMNNE